MISSRYQSMGLSVEETSDQAILMAMRLVSVNSTDVISGEYGKYPVNVHDTYQKDRIHIFS